MKRKFARAISFFLSAVLFATTIGSDFANHSVQAAAGELTYEVDSGMGNVENLMKQFGYIVFSDLTFQGHQHANVMAGKLTGNSSECTIRTTIRGQGESFVNFIREFDSLSGDLKLGYEADVLIVGTKYTVKKDGSQYKIGNCKVDKSGTVRREDEANKDGKKYDRYIDLDNLKSSFAKYSKQLASMEPTLKLQDNYGENSDLKVDFADMNNLLINVKQTNGMAVLNVKADDLSYFDGHMMTIDFEGGQNSKAGVLINIDLNGKSSFSANSVKLKYGGNEKRLGEDCYGKSDNRIYWNFYDSSKAGKQYMYEGNINLGGYFVGTIIAPGATLKSSSNINGTVIVNSANVSGESHRANEYNLVPPRATDADFEARKEFQDADLAQFSASKRNEFLKNTEFALYDSTGRNRIAGPVTLGWDSEKNVAVASMRGVECSPDGKGDVFYYKLKEVKSPEGYMLSGFAVDCKVVRNSATGKLETYYKLEGEPDSAYKTESILLRNDPMVLELSKTVDDESIQGQLSGAQLQLVYQGTGSLDAIKNNSAYDGKVTVSGKTIVWTSGNSALELKYLPAGKYVYKELNAPAGYLKAQDISLEIKENGDVYLGNTKIDGKTIDMKDGITCVEIRKLDDEETPLSYAQMQLEYTGSDTSVDLRDVIIELNSTDVKLVSRRAQKEIRWTSGNASTVFKALPAGTYRLSEIAAPWGYQVAEPIEFEVEADGTLKTDATVSGNILTMTDKKIKPVINMFKIFVDPDGRETSLSKKSGAVFALYKTYEGSGKCSGQIGDSIEAVLDEETGRYVVRFEKDLEIGKTYYVKEIETPEGFEISDSVYGCYLGSDGTPVFQNIYGNYFRQDAETGYLICRNNEKTATVVFSKEAADVAGKEIPGATITLTSTDNADLSKVRRVSGPGVTYDLATNSITWESTEDQLILQGLRTGHYKMHEIAAPHGYKVATDIFFEVKKDKTITATGVSAAAVDSDQNLILMVDDAVKATVTFSKEETGLAGKEIPGATITLTSTDGADLSGVTKKSGPDMQYDSEKKAIVWTSGEKPLILEGLRVGQYKMSEIAAPHGYAVATDIFFEVGDDGKISATGMSAAAVTADKNLVLMTDDAIKATVTFSKEETGLAGKEIPGARIELTSTDGADLSRVTRKSGPEMKYSSKKHEIIWVSGEEPLVLEGLRVGTYKMSEVASPHGYAVATDIIFKVAEDGKITAEGMSAQAVDSDQNLVLMTDDAIKGVVTFSKEETGLAGKEIPGATITLTSTNGTDLSRVTKKSGPDMSYDSEENAITWTSGNEPLVLEGIRVGSYRMSEIAAPHGYAVATDITFKMEADGAITASGVSAHAVHPEHNLVLMTDDAIKVTASFSKEETGLAGKEIPGATITLTSTTGADLSRITRKSGPAMNYDSEKNAITWTSGEKPLILEGLRVGTYKMSEIAAPHGYAVATDILFTVTEDGTITADGMSAEAVDKDENLILMTDDAIKVTVAFSKEETDLAGKEIPGAEITLTSVSGADLSGVKRKSGPEMKYNASKKSITWTSGEEPLILEGLRVGTYKMSEIAAPHGYAVATDILFTVTDEGKLTADGVSANAVDKDKNLILMVDDAITGIVTFSKEETGLAGKEIPGAKITLSSSTGTDLSKVIKRSGPEIRYDEADNTITWTSGEEPLVLEGLRTGTYVMSEIAAPSGYAVATDITFTVTGDGTITADGVSAKAVDEEKNLVLMTDDAIPVVVTFSKEATGLAGKEIPGAKIKLTASEGVDLSKAKRISGPDTMVYDADAKAITWISGTEALRLAGLSAGTYVMHEIAAPSGYEVATDITFEITSDGKLKPVSVEAGVVDKEKNLVLMTDDAIPEISFSKEETGLAGKEIPGARITLVPEDGMNLSKVKRISGPYSMVYKEESNTIEWISSTEPLKLKGLPAGKYVMKEIAAPSGYEVATDIEFEITMEGVLKPLNVTAGAVDASKELVLMVDDAIPVAVTFSKEATGLAGEEIPGAKIQLSVEGDIDLSDAVRISGPNTMQYDDYDNVITWISGEEPLRLAGLKPGTYTMHEIAAPSGYEVATDIVFKITDDKILVPVSATAGAVDPTQNLVLLVDDAIPVVTFSKEATGLAGKEIPGAKITLITEEGNDLSKVTRVAGPDTMKYDKKSDTIQWISGEEPLQLAGLSAGTYVLHEIAAPSGYAVATDIEFKITEAGKLEPVSVKAEAVDASKNLILLVDDAIPVMTFSKEATGLAGKEIPGARIELISKTGVDLSIASRVSGPDTMEYDPEKNVICWESGEEPLELAGLSAGIYVMHEIAAPSGYAVATDMTFEITKQGSLKPISVEAGAVDKEKNLILLVDDAIPVMTFSKEATGLAGKEIPGAKIELSSTTGADLSVATKVSGPDTMKYNSEKNVISWESGDKPLELAGLSSGTYVMHEVAAPSGYAVATDMTFEITEKGELKPISVKAGAVDKEKNLILMVDDALPVVTISLEEEGKSGKELPGGTMELHTTSGADLSKVEKISGPDIKYDPEKNVISWESGDEQLELVGLPEGSYEIIEKDAPSGYEKSEKIPFKVKEDGEVKSVPGSAGKVDPETNLVQMYNKEPEKKPTEITISLEEEGKSGKELPGGTMELHTTSGADLSKVEKISG
ncbi:MAG: choice-of-anchor A family protein, partial [Lachnospiraceae bacterium]|nr:choice-of-anchor A family protein [Lachnospiraceae bacterium]